MKICACLPLLHHPEKSLFEAAINDMRALCDEIIVMHDFRSSIDVGKFVSEELRITQQDPTFWHDYANRTTLLSRATRLGCECVMWLDDDELLGPSLTRERARNLCEEMIRGDYGQVIVQVRHMWNETHYRADGNFGTAKKTFFQLNPLMLKEPVFAWGPERKLHHFPNLDKPALEVQDYIVHFGLRTRSLREQNVLKYESADPECKFSCVPYNWLLDETGMELKPLIY